METTGPLKASGQRRALQEQQPWQGLLVLPAIVLSSALLAAWLSLPLLHAERMVLWKSTYTVWAGVVALWDQHEILLAIIVFLFSMVFPMVKLVALAVIWFIRLADHQRSRLLHWLEALGKWSMLDVFVVAILIVLVRLGPVAKIEPRSGVYAFAAAIFSSMLTTMYVERLARRSIPARPRSAQPLSRAPTHQP